MADRKEAPVVRARSRGAISGALERYAEEYRSRFPDRDVRYVYDPEHKPELSGVIGRQAQGYEMVTRAEVGMTGDAEEKPVRVGDLVLMSMPRKLREEELAYRAGLAKDQLKRVKREYYQQVSEEADAAQRKSGHVRAPMRPVGLADSEVKEFTYEVDQREE